MVLTRFTNIYEAIYESAPDGVIVVNEHGVIEVTNTRTCLLFGYEREELIGKPIEILMPERFVGQHQLHRKNYRSNPRTRDMGAGASLVGRRKDGNEFYVEISLSAVEIHNRVFVVACIRDVTEKKIVSKRLEEQDQKLKDQNVRLLNFAHVVSHNLRSYSGNFKTMLGFLENVNGAEDQQTIMKHLKNMANALHETIDHLSQVVTIQTTSPQLETISLHEYVEKTIASLQGEIIDSQAVVNNCVPCDVVVRYNPSYLESMLFNLLSNSLKYRDSIRKPLVTIQYVEENERKTVTISDNGRGIDLKKFGAKLFNIHATFHGNPDARGVGLFITKNQVEAMGGTIDVKSEPGVGTAFTILLN